MACIYAKISKIVYSFYYLNKLFIHFSNIFIIFISIQFVRNSNLYKQRLLAIITQSLFIVLL